MGVIGLVGRILGRRGRITSIDCILRTYSVVIFYIRMPSDLTHPIHESMSKKQEMSSS